MTDGKGLISKIYPLYIIVAIPYMIISLWEHLRHTLHALTIGWVPIVASGLGCVVVACRAYYFTRRRTPMPRREVLISLCVIAGFAGISAWNHLEGRIPDVTWTRVASPSPPSSRLRFLDEIAKGLVSLEAMMSPQDRKDLTERRRQLGYQDSNDTLKGVNYRIFKSNVNSRCPRAVAVRDGNNAYAGIYLIRDEQPPNQRLPAVGSRVELPRFPESHSEYQLIVIIFALDEATDQRMASDAFNPKTLIDLIWE